MKKRIIVILLVFAFISSIGYTQEVVENTTKPDTIVSVNDTSFSKGNIFTINPFQMIFYGEYLVGWERQVTDKYSYLLGVGVIYRTRQTNRSLIIMPSMFSEYYYGFHIYTGVKKDLGDNIFSVTHIIYIKYEKDINFDIVDGGFIDRFCGILSSDHYYFNIKVNRVKFVLGYKFLLGVPLTIHHIAMNMYTGAGVHIKYLDYDPYDFHGEIIHTQRLYPEISIHLGFTIGYRTR